MKNGECIIEQYRGGKLVRTFTPSGDDALPWRMSVNGKTYLRTHGWVMSKILPTLVEGSKITTKVVPIDGSPGSNDLPFQLQPRQVVEAWVEAFNRADPDSLASFYAEDAVNHQVVSSPIRGRKAIREMFAEDFASATMVCEVESIFEDGEWVILEWRDPLRLRGCGFFHIIDGLIVFQRGYWDRLSFLRLHGLPLPNNP